MKNCEMILAGFGGQGILFTGKILAFAAMLKDKKLSWLPSYGPEMRGGTANCHVIIDDEPIGSPIVTRPNILVAMNKPSLDKFENTVSDGGYVFIDTSLIDRRAEREDVNEICVNATETAHNIGNKSLANMVMLGAVLKKTELFTIDEIEYTMKKSLPEKISPLSEVETPRWMHVEVQSVWEQIMCTVFTEELVMRCRQKRMRSVRRKKKVLSSSSCRIH